MLSSVCVITHQNKLDLCSALVKFCLSFVMVTDQNGLHSVLLQLLLPTVCGISDPR